MSKTVPVYPGSSRLSSPACALLSAPRCLAASRISPPVHGVSTTSVTTPKRPVGTRQCQAIAGTLSRACHDLPLDAFTRDDRVRQCAITRQSHCQRPMRSAALPPPWARWPGSLAMRGAYPGGYPRHQAQDRQPRLETLGCSPGRASSAAMDQAEFPLPLVPAWFRSARTLQSRIGRKPARRLCPAGRP